MEQIIAKREGINRGWFTYTELNSILAVIDPYHLYQYIASLTVILLTTYAAGVLTIISSMFIVSQLPGNCFRAASTAIEFNCTSVCITNNPQCQPEILEAGAIEEIDDLNISNNHLHAETPFVRKQIDAADVLTTSLILASIQPVSNVISDKNKSYFQDIEINNGNNEKISWDWWSSPTMNWLSSISELSPNLNFEMPNLRDYVYIIYLDSTVVTTKIIEQEDHAHKATRTRIQDQLERSWHKEWTDTIKYSHFGYNKPFELLKNIKT